MPRRNGSSPSPLPSPPAEVGGELIELLQPGSFVCLHNHPHDLPPFLVIRCQGGRCWVRQQSWGRQLHWEVAHRQLRRAA
jgi:hypothetical protein